MFIIILIIDVYSRKYLLQIHWRIVMKFSVSKEVFEKLDNVCFGIVVAKGIDNTKENIEAKEALIKVIRECE